MLHLVLNHTLDHMLLACMSILWVGHVSCRDPDKANILLGFGRVRSCGPDICVGGTRWPTRLLEVLGGRQPCGPDMLCMDVCMQGCMYAGMYVYHRTDPILGGSQVDIQSCGPDTCPAGTPTRQKKHWCIFLGETNLVARTFEIISSLGLAMHSHATSPKIPTHKEQTL